MTIPKIIDQTKQYLEALTGGEISIKYYARYDGETIDRLKNIVCKVYNIEPKDLLRKCRDKELVRPRQMFYYIALEVYGLKVIEAAKMFGHDHTTAIHSRDKVIDLLSIMDEETHLKLSLIKKYLNENAIVNY